MAQYKGRGQMSFTTKSTDVSGIGRANSQLTIERVSAYDEARRKAILSVAGSKGISGWIFDIPMGETVSVSADMTDHYTESGSFITDHIVLKPDQITLAGLVGNLVYRAPQRGSLEYEAQNIANRLLAVNSYLGPFTQGALQKAAVIFAQVGYAANQLNALKKKASNVVNFFKGGFKGEKEPDLQTIAYHEIKAMMKSKQIVSVQTYWEYFPSMAIVSLTANHNEVTDDYTDISVTLKEARIVGIKKTMVDDEVNPTAVQAQSADISEKGNVSGEKGEMESILYNFRPR